MIKNEAAHQYNANSKSKTNNATRDYVQYFSSRHKTALQQYKPIKLKPAETQSFPNNQFSDFFRLKTSKNDNLQS